MKFKIFVAVIYLFSLYLTAKNSHLSLTQELIPEGITLNQTLCVEIEAIYPQTFDSQKHKWSKHILKALGKEPEPFVRHGIKHQIALVCKKDPGTIETIAITSDIFLAHSPLHIGMDHTAVEEALKGYREDHYKFNKRGYYVYTVINADGSTVTLELINDALKTVSIGNYGPKHIERVKKYSQKF